MIKLLKEFKLLVSILLIFITTQSNAVYVKYRGFVDTNNGHFKHYDLPSSSLVNDLYYDLRNKYVVVQLKSAYYHYCSVPQFIVDNWVSSYSLGSYYFQKIKGNYDCRYNFMPTYTER